MMTKQELLENVLDMWLTQKQMDTIKNEWEAFYNDPMQYKDSLVVYMVKQYLKEMKQEDKQMMKIKEYKLFKSTKKTAKENNLEMSTFYKDILFDFSALDSMVIPDSEKEVIKQHALKYVCVSNRLDFYNATFSQFECCTGKAIYLKHVVYNNTTWKRAYVIMQLTEIGHCHLERKSIYDKWDNTITEYSDGYVEPMNDIEI